MEGFFFCCRSTVFFFKQIRYLSKPVYILALVLSRSNQGRCNIIKTYQDPRHMTSVTYRPLFKDLLPTPIRLPVITLCFSSSHHRGFSEGFSIKDYAIPQDVSLWRTS